MREFAEAFLLVFAQLSVGGAFTLIIPSFQQLGRGYFKSTAAVYWSLGLLAVAGWIALAAAGTWSTGRIVEIGLWVGFLAAFAAYLYSLWGDRFRFRAKIFVATLVLGAAALALTSLRYAVLAPSVGVVVFPAAFLASAALLGTACSGMLLGHWYLIDLDLTLTPFRRMHRAFVGAIVLQLVVSLCALAGLIAVGGGPVIEAVMRLATDHPYLFGLRILVGCLSASALAWMIGRTLDIPQTMAATGLFYIALLAVVVGEILGRTILFRTALPL